MPQESRGLYRLGGVSLIASGLLFLVRQLLDLAAGPPPSSGEEILAWAASHRLSLAFVSEVTFLAVVFLVPAVLALHASLAGVGRAKAAAGCGILAVAIPVLAVLLVVHGRLVFPVYGIRLTPAAAELVVAVFYGGVHAADLLLAIATFVLSLSMWRGVYGVKVASLGFAAGVAEVVASYPWALGPVTMLVCQILFSAWFVAVGSKLYRWPAGGANDLQGVAG